MRKIFFGITVLALVAAAPVAGLAASPWTEESGYWQKVEAKAHFGLTNLFLGWLSMFSESEDAADKGQNAFAAFGKGLLHFPVFTVGWLLHLITCPLPQIDIPLPNNGVSV